MQVIAAIEHRAHVIGVGWIARHLVEIDHVAESVTGSDPADLILL